MAARKRNRTLTKQEFIQVTSRMIEEEGYESISIRKIANRVGCDSATLYYHFGSLDYLIYLSSITFMEDYAQELLYIERIQEKNIDRAIDSWHACVHTMYQNPPLFYHLFYDGEANLFQDAIVEYYQLFPMQLQDKGDIFYGFLFASLFAGSSYKRNYYYFNRAANEHSIDRESVDYLCAAVPGIAANMLHRCTTDYSDPVAIDKATKECTNYIDRVIESCRIDEHLPRITLL